MRGATLERLQYHRQPNISIHAPHAGSDHTARVSVLVSKDFNPRSPCGERPEYFKTAQERLMISIHAPHAGSDLALTRALHKERTISIHAPHAGSDPGNDHFLGFLLFQSTLPMRGATTQPRKAFSSSVFQSTLPMRGATKE